MNIFLEFGKNNSKKFKKCILGEYFKNSIVTLDLY